MNLNLAGKSVVITGGSRGIGYACAEAFASEGCGVTLVGSHPESVASAAERLKAKGAAVLDALCLDLSAPEGMARLAERLQASDIVVNNAGAIPGGGLEDLDDARWRMAWELKVFGYINAVRQALPKMLERQQGVIVNIIGTAGVAPNYSYLCGTTANGALMNFTKAVGEYAARHGVRVLGVNPGATETERLVTIYKGFAKAQLGDESRWRELLTQLPFGRPARPQEIADLVTFIASPRASYLSGVVIDADGGGIYHRG
jgi:3-oxoacyl-[acyl-carrier protein] reductase